MQDYADDYDELAADEELESFYFSSAAGQARVVLGNRRFGEGERRVCVGGEGGRRALRGWEG